VVPRHELAVSLDPPVPLGIGRTPLAGGDRAGAAVLRLRLHAAHRGVGHGDLHAADGGGDLRVTLHGAQRLVRLHDTLRLDHRERVQVAVDEAVDVELLRVGNLALLHGNEQREGEIGITAVAHGDLAHDADLRFGRDGFGLDGGGLDLGERLGHGSTPNGVPESLRRTVGLRCPTPAL